MRKTTVQSSETVSQSKFADDALTLHAVTIVGSYLSHNLLVPSEIPAIIASVHAELRRLATGAPTSRGLEPAVSIKKSVGDDYIVCLEDGKRLTMLKRYLKSHYNLSPDEYRKKWGLPRDYPMVAPAYARLRSTFAKKIGLGRIPTSRKKKR